MIFAPRGWFPLPDEDVLVLDDVDTLVERLDRFELGPDLSLDDERSTNLGPREGLNRSCWSEGDQSSESWGQG